MIPFALTIFLSAFLLFQVQPIIARFILPWYGGSPAVWTTCMLFFQAALLLGYCYADVVARRLALSRQLLVHVTLLVLSLFLLPIIPRESLRWGAGEDPALSILWLLLLTIGGNYCLLATTGPLLQHWFAKSFPDRSPYRLFALSNFGSLLALLGYPLMVETTLPIRRQAEMWSWGYGIFVIVGSWAAWQTWKRRTAMAGVSPSAGSLSSDPEGVAVHALDTTVGSANALPQPIGARRLLAWLILSTLPSVLLLTITNEISQEIAVVPMLWIAPLSLYLISFIICFERASWYRRDVFGVLLIVSTFSACICLANPTGTGFLWQFATYCLLLFSACMTLHGELASLKPVAERLTTYYLFISLGGALGGVLVVLVAPLLFTGFYELQISIALAVLVTFVRWWQAKDGQTLTRVMVVVSILASTGFVVGFIRFRLNINENVLYRLAVVAGLWFISFSLLGWQHLSKPGANNMSPRQKVAPGRVASGLWLATLMVVFLFSWLLLNLPDWMRGVDALLGLALVLWIWWVGVYTHSRPIVSFATYVNLALIFMVFLFQVLVIAIGVQMAKREGRVIDARRNFFGISGVERVHSPTDGFYKEIFNGRIGHGRQYEREDLAQEVNLYYGPGSGVGLALNYHPKRLQGQPIKVGVIGLGTGTLAAWGRQGDEFIYYEINPAVIDLAEEHFSYFENSLADCETRLGDARILLEQTLRENRPENFDVLIVDAFSSDAIPRHLLTREAMAVYAQHLADGGVIAIHISNWFLRLDPVVFGIAEDAGFQAVNIYHEVLDSQRFHSSDWMLVSKNQEFLNQPIIHDSEYQGPELKRILWTDDFGSVLQVMKVKRPEYWPIEWWPFYYK